MRHSPNENVTCSVTCCVPVASIDKRHCSAVFAAFSTLQCAFTQRFGWMEGGTMTLRYDGIKAALKKFSCLRLEAPQDHS